MRIALKRSLPIIFIITAIFVLFACDPSDGGEETIEPTVTTESLNTPEETTSEEPSTETETMTVTETETESETEVIEKDGTLTVVNYPFDKIYSSNNDLIIGIVNNRRGAVNSKGEVVIPFEYDEIQAVSPDGYVVASKIDVDYVTANQFNTRYTTYLLDSAGHTIIKFICTITSDYSSYRAIGSRIHSYSDGILITYQEKLITSRGKSVLLKDVSLRTPDGKGIKQFKNVLSLSGNINGMIVMKVVTNTHTMDSKWIIVNSNGETVSERNFTAFKDYFSSLEGTWVNNGVKGGFFAKNRAPEGGFELVSSDMNTIYSFSSFSYVDHYGTTVILKNPKIEYDNELFYFIDASKTTDQQIKDDAFISTQGYEYLSFDAVFGEEAKYALASKDSKWGYVSIDGKTEKFFDDAGAFRNGHAIVRDGDNIYVINEAFEKISNEITEKYDAVYTIGPDLYALLQNGKLYPAVYTK